MMRFLVVLAGVLLAAACDGCINNPTPDAGTGSSSSSGGRSDGGRGDGGARDGGRVDAGDAGPRCSPETPGYGESCGECGAMICGNDGELTCQDPGKNQCGVCGQLLTTGGILGRDCGTCGTVTCADGGLATECTGEHPKNDCGGCGTIPVGRGPPDAGCSTCLTGTWACQSSLNDVSCWMGRAPTSCGGCGQCVKFHAAMQDLSQGQFVRAGTTAIIEDVGVDTDVGTSQTQPLILTFNPYVVGPAGLQLPQAVVYLSPTMEHTDPGAFALSEWFAASVLDTTGDPVRQYRIYFPVDSMRWVIIYDGFLGQVVSRGELVMGPPSP